MGSGTVGSAPASEVNGGESDGGGQKAKAKGTWRVLRRAIKLPGRRKEDFIPGLKYHFAFVIVLCGGVPCLMHNFFGNALTVP